MNTVYLLFFNLKTPDTLIARAGLSLIWVKLNASFNLMLVSVCVQTAEF